MLQYLKIRDLAHIEEVELEWQPGFTTVTGETGAGKSVLIGALSLLAGERADKSIIRAGADACSVDAELFFADASALDAVLESQGLPKCEDGQLVIRRVLSATKSARIHINGAVATRQALELLGEQWIDFHGPGEHQRLLHDAHQLTLLDLYAGHTALLRDYQTVYAELCALDKKMEALRTSERLSVDEQDYLRKQIEMIDAVQPETSVIEALEAAFNRATHQQELIELSATIEDSITGEDGVLKRMFTLRQHAESLARILPEGRELAQRINSLLIELEDIAGEYSTLSGQDELDAESVEAIQQKMSAWLDIKRRYGPTPARVLEKRQQLADKLANQSDVEGKLAELETERERIEKEGLVRAESLYKSRLKAGDEMIREVNKLLKSLGFKSARLAVEFVALKSLQPQGLHKVQMFFQPNPGSPAQPLGKIASSGEAARVMLAIKTSLADRDATPVLVFDEVDANVGGEIGMEVGRELAALGKRHQVLCITHLPQVASQAKNHICVSKTQTQDQTFVSIKNLDTSLELRVDELARMLGDRHSKTAREHARELLEGSGI